MMICMCVCDDDQESKKANEILHYVIVGVVVLDFN